MLPAGQIVRSKAGRDKGRFHVVVEAKAGWAMIADGKARKLEKPKRKNALHLAPTNMVLDLSLVTTDKKLRQALQAYAGQNEEGGYSACQNPT